MLIRTLLKKSGPRHSRGRGKVFQFGACFLAAALLIASLPVAVGESALAQESAPWRKDMVDETPSHYYLWYQNAVAVARYNIDNRQRDKNGIVMVEYRHLDAPVYNPVTVAIVALRANEAYLHQGDTVFREDFLRHALWLRDAGMDTEGRFPYRFPYTRPGTTNPPWYSAMAQGLGISAMLRAYALTGDETFLEASRRAFKPFLVDISQGGVVSDGGNWLEEYPDGHQVLNGKLFALFGLYDLYRATGDLQVKELFQRASSHLADNLHLYEANGAVLYELFPRRYSHPLYYRLQNEQLLVLSELTGNSVFAQVSHRWSTEFRAYPAPVFNVAREHRFAQGRTTRIHGRIDYLFRAYFPVRPSVRVKQARADGVGGWSTVAVVGLDFTDGFTAEFTYVTPPLITDMRYRFEVIGEASLAQFGCDYPITAYGETTVRMSRPNVANAWVVSNPATPNGDGWNDHVHIGYDLTGGESYVTIQLLNASGQVVASRRGRTAGGLHAPQRDGRWWARFDLKDSRGRVLPDGVYRYVVTATASGLRSSRSGNLFISHRLTLAPALGTRPVISRIWAAPTPFTPGRSPEPVTRFGFNLSEPAWVTVKVFDSRGVARVVVNNARLGAGRHYPSWNGRDAHNRLLPPGNYVYYVFASSGGPRPVTSFASRVITIR